MNLNQIETFLWVAELNSFTAAARQLFMSQPAISFQIKAIEDELHVSLFKRHDKKVTLTEAGSLFYKEAKEIIEHYYKITEGINNIKGLKKGKLNLGASTIPGEYVLPHFIGRFKKIYPDIEISLKIGDSGNVINWIKKKEVALGITGAKVYSEGIECQPWIYDKLVLIAPFDFQPGGKDNVSLEELITYPFIVREKNSGTRKTQEKILEEKGLYLDNLNVYMELGSTRSVLTAVEAGLGVSFISSWAARDSRALGNIIILNVPELNLERKLYLVRNTLALGGGFAASVFMEYLEENDKFMES
ncbi:MAG: LysR family transcriptional regulator [Clostridiales bacterium]|nr:LysR family transcriptional regulator [Clostridiales bacterium]MCF8023273.1 LysR family transcriptional regulator [Clostridiales bacterium]